MEARTILALTIVLLLLAVGLGASSAFAGGSDPALSGETQEIEFETYYGAEAPLNIKNTIRIHRMIETNQEADWYMVGNTIRQWRDNPHYYRTMFVTEMGESEGGFPDQVEADPTTQNVGASATTYTLSGGSSGVGGSASVTWTNQWHGDWYIKKSETSAGTEGWGFYVHDNRFKVNPTLSDVTYDWARQTHYDIYKVTQGREHGVWIQGGVKWRECNPFWCSGWEWENSGAVWYGFPTNPVCDASTDECSSTITVPAQPGPPPYLGIPTPAEETEDLGFNPM